MAAFIAILVDDERLKELGKLFEEYGYEPPPLLHVTILFLGDVSGIYLHRIVDALAKRTFVAPKKLKVVGYELFPPGKETNIVLLVDEPKLMELRNQVLNLVKPVKEDRFEYRPHVTIARRARSPSKEVAKRVAKLLEELWRSGRVPRSITCRSLALIKSARGAYEIVARLS